MPLPEPNRILLLSPIPLPEPKRIRESNAEKNQKKKITQADKNIRNAYVPYINNYIIVMIVQVLSVRQADQA